MDFKDININLDSMNWDNNRKVFIYTPAVGMEVKTVISSLCKISKTIDGHSIETDINDIIIKIDEKSDENKVYQNYLKSISKRHKTTQITSAKHPRITPDNSLNFE